MQKNYYNVELLTSYARSELQLMGCDLDKPAMVVPVPEVLEEEGSEFSETQIDTIRSTWPLLSRNLVRVGLDVFTRIFRETPSIRKLFEPFGINDIDNLHQYPQFCEHAQKFMRVIESLVEHLEQPEVIQTHLVALGARHATVEGYHPEYFRFFIKCLLEVWEGELGEEFIAEVRESWTRVFDYLIRCMSHGYHICVNDQIDHMMTDEAFHKVATS